MEQKNNSFIKGALCGALLTFVICGGGVAVLLSLIWNTSTSHIISDETISKLETIDSYIDSYFLYDIDEEALEEGLFQGYLAALDDSYTSYYTVEETSEIWDTTSGVYSGVGASMSQDLTSGVITLITIFEDSPAQEAGLIDGDILVEVDGTEVTGEDLTNVVANIKGEEGTTVDLTIYRSSTNETITVTATRGLVENPTVNYEMLENQVGYIQVTEFDTVTYEQFNEAMNELESENMESLIIDLRNNTGGNLDTVCEMLELILPEGLIVYTEDKYGNVEEITCSGENEFTKPLAVLVNGYSASASEIFAGAVQDYGIGAIVGTTTYGKGVVQQLIGLEDGSMIKLTISEYFTPLGRNIHGIGIEPDIEVTFDYEDMETDEQLNAAIEAVTQ